MPRLMSVTLTEQAVVEHRKTVTRRLGWWQDRNDRPLLKVGDRLTLCRKVMGRRHRCTWCSGQASFCDRCDGTGTIVDPLVRLAEAEVVDLSRQQVSVQNTVNEAAREGFPEWTWGQFVEFFCTEMKVPPHRVITRIEFRYLDEVKP